MKGVNFFIGQRIAQASFLETAKAQETAVTFTTSNFVFLIAGPGEVKRDFQFDSFLNDCFLAEMDEGSNNFNRGVGPCSFFNDCVEGLEKRFTTIRIP